MKSVNKPFISTWLSTSKKTGYDSKPMTWITETPASYEDENGNHVNLILVSYGKTRKDSQQEMYRTCMKFGQGCISLLAKFK